MFRYVGDSVTPRRSICGITISPCLVLVLVLCMVRSQTGAARESRMTWDLHSISFHFCPFVLSSILAVVMPGATSNVLAGRSVPVA